MYNAKYVHTQFAAILATTRKKISLRKILQMYTSRGISALRTNASSQSFLILFEASELSVSAIMEKMY